MFHVFTAALKWPKQVLLFFCFFIISNTWSQDSSSFIVYLRLIQFCYLAVVLFLCFYASIHTAVLLVLTICIKMWSVNVSFCGFKGHIFRLWGVSLQLCWRFVSQCISRTIIDRWIFRLYIQSDCSTRRIYINIEFALQWIFIF